MKFTNLTIDNFLSVEHVETHLNDRGLMLIKGINMDADAFESNGSGKSTIFSDSIVWCLFGDTLRGERGDEVVNSQVGKNCCVSLCISDDNGDEYEIQRYRKDKEHKNTVLLFLNGINKTGKSDADTNKLIQQILQMDFLSFTNSVLFGQGISKQFAEATDTEQKRILECMLQIDIFKNCQEKAKEHSTEKSKERDKITQQLEVLATNKLTLQKVLEDLKIKDDELTEKVAEEIKSLNIQLKEQQAELDDMGNIDEQQKNEDKFTVLKVLVANKLKHFEKHSKNKDVLTADINDLEKEKLTNTKLIDKTKIRLKELFTKSALEIRCELCNQIIPLEDVEGLQTSLEDSICSLREKNQETDEQISENNGFIAKLDKKLEGKEKLEEDKQGYLEDIAGIQADIRVFNKQKTSIESSISSTMKQIVKQKELSAVTYSVLIEDNLNKVAVIEKQVKENEDSLELVKADLEILEFWILAYGNQGIKSVLLDNVTPYLNQRANHYLNKLADNSIEILFQTQTILKSGESRDKFKVEVTNANGGDVYKGNSSGEKRRIDIAINLALQDLMQSRSNKTIDLCVYDEVFSGLDSVGCENVIFLLREKEKVCGTILVMSHDDALKELFTDSITVKKQDKKTTILKESM